MIISHAKKFVFIHNPKSAGTSIRKALQKYHDDPKEYWHHEFIPLLNRVVDLAHLDVHEISQVRPDLKDYTFFTVVRDPVERTVSAYSYALSQRLIPPSNIYGISSFSAFVEYLDLVSTQFDWKLVHFKHQYNYFRQDISGFKPVVFQLGGVLEGIRSIVDASICLTRENVSEVPLTPAAQDITLLKHFYRADYDAFADADKITKSLRGTKAQALNSKIHPWASLYSSIDLAPEYEDLHSKVEKVFK